MRRLSRIYRRIVITILLQTLVLAYVNFIYLPNRGSVTASVYVPQENVVAGRRMTLPEGALNIQVSFNGLYAAYLNGDTLVISDIRTGKAVKTISYSKGTPGCFRWLPDRDMLIYSVTSPDGEKGNVLISTYDIGPELDRSYPEIKGLPAGSEAVRIELSPLTNMVYIMIKTDSSHAKIYKYDIMDNLKFVMNTGINTKLKEMMYSNYLLYQSGNGRIYTYNGKTADVKPLSAAGSLLLGVDSEDNIYTGRLNGDSMVTEIYSGKTGQQASAWDKTVLDAPVDAGDIYVAPGGKIYIAERQQKRVMAENTGNIIKYDGKLLDILDDYIVSLDGNWLVLTVL